MMADFPARRYSATDVLKALARPALHLSREIPVRSDLVWQRGRGPLAVFLPATGREGASLLRIYLMAGVLRRLGWRSAVLPWQLTLAQRRRLLAAAVPDVVVMQGVRHALNRPDYYPGAPVVMDMDDADFHLPHLSGPLRRVMPGIPMVLAGSTYVAEWCLQAGAGEAHVVWTGTPVSTRPRPPQAARPPVVAWAQSRPMTYLREAELIREVAARIGALRPGATLRLYDRQPDDDPGFAQSFRAPGLVVEWVGTTRYSDYLTSFDDVALGFAPLCPDTPFSRGKSFGKVLAYLDRGVPVIASDAGEHGRFFTPETGIVSNDPGRWVVEAVRLLDDPAARQKMSGVAFAAFCDRLTLDAAAVRVDRILRRVVDEAGARETG